MKKIIALAIIIFISSCAQKENDLEFEKKVMNEIFINLVDSIFRDYRLLPPPPMPPPPNGIIISDSLNKENIKRRQKILADFEKRKVAIEQDTSRIVIAIVDTIFIPSRTNHITLKKYFKNVEFKNDSLENTIEYKVNLSQFDNNNRYLFKYYSEFPKGREIWRTEYPYHLGGLMSFSRIYFDTNKEFGVLEVGFSYGILNGNGFRIFIKRKFGKWVIDKIEGTWIS